MIFLDLPGFPRISMDFPGFPRISMDFHGFPWISLDFHGFPWISLDFPGFPWISMDFHGFPWISLDFPGFLWISLDFSGFSWIFLYRKEEHTYLIDFSTISRTVQLFSIGSCTIYIWHEWRIEAIKKSTPSLDRWGQTKGHQKAQTKSPHGLFWSGQVWTGLNLFLLRCL